MIGKSIIITSIIIFLIKQEYSRLPFNITTRIFRELICQAKKCSRAQVIMQYYVSKVLPDLLYRLVG